MCTDINPFDSCCYMSEMDSWTARVRAIKAGNPQAKVLATFHATEIWLEDISAAHRWLPPKCLMRNKDGSACTWWKNLVFTNNLFQPECLQAAVDNEQLAHRKMYPTTEDGTFVVGNSVKLSEYSLQPVRPYVAEKGQHTEMVLAELARNGKL